MLHLWLFAAPGTSRPKFQHRRTLIIIPADGPGGDADGPGAGSNVGAEVKLVRSEASTVFALAFLKTACETRL